MMHRILILVLALGLGACQSRSEANLPRAGTLVVKRDTPADRYQVTWSGISTYNMGACEVKQPCVHLVRTVNTDNRVEVAVTIGEFSRQYRRID